MSQRFLSDYILKYILTQHTAPAGLLKPYSMAPIQYYAAMKLKERGKGRRSEVERQYL